MIQTHFAPTKWPKLAKWVRLAGQDRIVPGNVPGNVPGCFRVFEVGPDPIAIVSESE